MSDDVMAWLASAWAPRLPAVRRECWWVHDPMGPPDDGATCDGASTCTAALTTRRSAAYAVIHAEATAQGR